MAETNVASGSSLAVKHYSAALFANTLKGAIRNGKSGGTGRALRGNAEYRGPDTTRHAAGAGSTI